MECREFPDLNARYQNAKQRYIQSGVIPADPIDPSDPVEIQLKAAQALGKQWNTILNLNPDLKKDFCDAKNRFSNTLINQNQSTLQSPKLSNGNRHKR